MERDETHDVEVWRQQQLEEAGFPRLTAYGLAVRLDIDYHRALDLLDRGCQPELIARIL